MSPHDVLIAFDALQDSSDQSVRAWAVAVLEAFDARAPFKPTLKPRPIYRIAGLRTHTYFLDGLAIRDVL